MTHGSIPSIFYMASQPASYHVHQNPYAAPTASASGPIDSYSDFEYARSRIRPPAIALAIVFGLQVLTSVGVLAIFGLVLAFDSDMNSPDFISLVIMAVFHGCFGLLSVVGIFGAFQMMQVKNYGVAMATAIFAMIFCVQSCGVITAGMGIWALVMLLDERTKRAFRQA